MNIKSFFKRLFPKKLKSECCNAEAIPWIDRNGDDCFMCAKCHCATRPKD